MLDFVVDSTHSCLIISQLSFGFEMKNSIVSWLSRGLEFPPRRHDLPSKLDKIHRRVSVSGTLESPCMNALDVRSPDAASSSTCFESWPLC